jgi:hypothetical protein
VLHPKGISEEVEGGIMEYLDLAPETLQAFSAYAKKIEQLPETNDVLVLRLHKDGSGCICASRWHRIEYIGFNDLADLLQKLRKA